MSEARKRILKLLAEGKVTPDQAERLIDALNEEDGAGSMPPKVKKTPPKFLRVLISTAIAGGDKKDVVNLRIPYQFLRAGARLASIMPRQATDRVNDALNQKGYKVDLGRITPDQLDDLVAELGEMEFNVADEKGHVRIFFE